jgi:Ca-activated chloride channel family protein
MNWGAPEWVVLIWVLPVLALLIVFALRSRARALSALGPLVESSVGLNSRSRNRRRLVLQWCAVSLILVALAQPRWGFRWMELKQEGLNIVVVLDTSLSMNAEDVSPSRMERAHREVMDLSDLLQGDRVGLVLFSGGAYTRMPLTLDYNALRSMTRKSNTRTLRSQGSDLGAAIREAHTVLGPEGKADRAIIIISDGEDQVGQAPIAAKAAIDDGVRIFAMGVGTIDGAPIPLSGGGFKKDESDGLVLTRLGEEVLQQVAEIGQGAYVRSVAGSADIRAIYGDEIVGKLKRGEQMVRREKVWLERFQWPLGVAWVLALLAFAVRGRGVATVALVGMLMGSTVVQAAPQSIAELSSEQVASPNDMAVAERLGSALFKAGRFNEAEDVLRSVADRSQDPEAKARARYNSALSAYRGGRLTHALEAWQRVLQDHPDNAAAKKNAAAVQAEIQKRLGEEPPPQDQEGENQEDSEEQPPNDDTAAPQNDGTREPPETPPTDDTGSVPEPPEPSESSESRGDTGSPEPQPAEVVEISEQEAERMFDAVEEGDPRVIIDPGSKGGKDW